MAVEAVNAELLEERIAELAAVVRAAMVRTFSGVAHLLQVPTPVAAAAAEYSVDDLGTIVARWSDAVDADLSPLVAATFQEQAQDTMRRAGMSRASFNRVHALVEPGAVEYLSTADNRMKGVGGTMWRQARARLVKDFAAGEPAEVVARTLADVLQISEGRAMTVARTELTGAANAGALLSAHANGFTVAKQWLATNDKRTRPTHDHGGADGQVVPLGEPFLVGGARLRHPGDPTGPAREVVNCRCTMLLLDREEAGPALRQPELAGTVGQLREVPAPPAPAPPIAAPEAAQATAGAELHQAVMELGDESRSVDSALSSGERVPVTAYGLRHDDPDALARGKRLADDTLGDTDLAERRRVPLAGLLTDQPTVNPHHIVKLVTDPAETLEEGGGYGPDDLPMVYDVGGKLVIQDGHHRAIADAARSGNGTFEAWVWVESALTAAGSPVTHRPDGMVPMTNVDAVMADLGLSAELASLVVAVRDGARPGPLVATAADEARARELVAAALAVGRPEEFHAVLAVEGSPTGDGREFAPGSITWPTEPIPYMWRATTGLGHDGAALAGAITRIERIGNEIHGWGYYDHESAAGWEAARVARRRLPVGVSIDPDQIAAGDVELVYPAGADPDDPMVQPELARFHAGRLRGATQLPFQALIEAKVEWIGPDDPEPAEEDILELAAAASPVPPAAPDDDPPDPDDDEGGTVAPGARVRLPGTEGTEAVVLEVLDDDDQVRVRYDDGTEAVVPTDGLEVIRPAEADRDPEGDAAPAVTAGACGCSCGGTCGGVQAAANDPGGAGMVALVPTEADATRLAVPGYEPPEVLHVTLAFLGDKASPEQRAELAKAIEAFAGIESVPGPVQVEAFGSAVFNPTADDAASVYVIGAGKQPELARRLTLLRDEVDGIASRTLGAVYPPQHAPWVPHLTVGYGLGLEQLQGHGPITFDRIRIAYGDADVTDFPLSVQLEVPADPDGDDPQAEDEAVEEALVAAAYTVTIPDAPPKAWYAKPDDDLLRDGALTITDEGRVYGLLAPAGVPHQGRRDRVFAPMGNVDYRSRFLRGETPTAEGDRVVTGNLTFNCGHAPVGRGLNGQAAAEHYDHSCSVFATVSIGECAAGTWVAGALLANVDGDTIRRAMACQLSGDWRPAADGRGYEFAGALLVPVPGFPMQRRAPTASTRWREQQDGRLAMVASAAPVRLHLAPTNGARTAAYRFAIDTLAAAVGMDPASRVQALRRQVLEDA